MREMVKKSLQDAFCGESQAHMKYLIFAEAAEKENKPNIAKIFRAIAYAEFVHAKNHARSLGYIKGTGENLAAAIEGEDFEVGDMYPAYLELAKLFEEKQAQRSFHYAIEAEKIHSQMYKEAHKEAEKDEDMVKVGNIWVCPVCGYTYAGDEAPDKCPVCGLDKENFKKF